MYTKNNKPKKSTTTEHVELTLTMAQVFRKIVPLKKEYTVHKYQIYNDKFYRQPNILFTTSNLSRSINPILGQVKFIFSLASSK